ncbi:MAG TPA: site-specific integrase [Dongiaceae bacterium]|nr:site-specific integrase [Dongiaceae bacterium]
MTGHIRRRGERSWEIKFDTGRDSLTGRRLTKYHSFKGTKREAAAELVRLKAVADKGEYIDPSKVTLSEFLDRWETWAETQVSAKTLERYKELASHHIRPHLGGMRVQKLRPVNFAVLYGKLQCSKNEGGAALAPRTVGHVHRLMHRVLGSAVQWGLLAANPVATAKPPRVSRTEIEILAPGQIKTVLDALQGGPLHIVAIVSLATGMRRGEVVGLRWNDVDLDAGRIRVERSLEQTNAGLTFKAPKTKAGRRSIPIPPSVVAELHRHWREQQEMRLQLGLGRADEEDLVFPKPDGSVWPPDSLTSEWARAIRILKVPKVTLHALRHTHVSQLIAAGLDVVSVSRRIGHSNPTVTLGVYAHLFDNTDEKAAAVVEAALAGALKG